MTEKRTKSKGCLWIVLVAVIVVLFPVLSTFALRTLADWEIQPLCKAEGGIRVFEKDHLALGESLTPGSINWSSYDEGRSIGKNFRIKRTHVFMKKYGAAVYKYTAWVERNSDKKRLSELTWYFREGNEIFHGKHCPENPSEQELIFKTLSIPPA